MRRNFDSVFILLGYYAFQLRNKLQFKDNQTMFESLVIEIVTVSKGK